MLVINRQDGSVSGQLSAAERDELWKAIVRNMGPKAIERAEQQLKQDSGGANTECRMRNAE